MGASRKLQGEIDRVLKKVQEGVEVFDSIWNKVYDTDNANQKEKFEADLKKEIKKLQRYRDQIKTWIQSSEIKDKKVSAAYEQALVDARKLIEREMERFKICEKETKTKAFSKEGLGQQPKTDPKEKAKSETRDWLNNVVGELESQIDSFEAELEGLSVRKGKTRPPRLTHLETSITRHKAHIIKLELILRLLDNDELTPEEVNDVKDFLDDYVERNQEDFDEFSEVDELYSSLPLDKVEALEDLVTTGPLIKGTPVSMKTPLAGSASTMPISTTSSHQQSTSQEQAEDKASPKSNPEIFAKSPPPKNSMNIHSASSTPPPSLSINVPAQNFSAASKPSTPLSGSNSVRGVMENPINSLSPLSPSVSKEEDIIALPARRSSPSLADSDLVKGIGRGGLSTQPSSGVPPSPGVSSATEIPKRDVTELEGTLGSGSMGQPSISPISNRMMLPQANKNNDGAGLLDGNPSDAAGMGGRLFSPSVVSGMQWRPGSPFQNQNESGHFRGRPEIVPDQKEKFLHRLQQVQQQGHSALLGMPPLSGGNSLQVSAQQQNPLLQQSSSTSVHGGPGPGVQLPGLSAVDSASVQQQSSSMHQQPSSQPLMLDVGHSKSEEKLQSLPDDSTLESTAKNLANEDDFRAALDSPAGLSSSLTEPSQVAKASDFSPGQPIQGNQPSGSLGVIGRRSLADLGSVGDVINGSTVQSGGRRDQTYYYQMLDAAFRRLPQAKDSERPRHYTPRRPAATPPSYPQVQAPIINNSLFWERLGNDAYGINTLFFAFYFQPNTYQQYLAARELKKQAWRYHKKHNTWFQRHDEPKVVTDEYEQGSYVYFDFNVDKDGQHGWCQRMKTDFAFEYQYLEDELLV